MTSDTTDPTCTEAGKAVYTAKRSRVLRERNIQKQRTKCCQDQPDILMNIRITEMEHIRKYVRTVKKVHPKRIVMRIASVNTVEQKNQRNTVTHTAVRSLNGPKDGKSCTAVFSCKDGDDEQRVECEVTSKITDPTCTEDGKTVYTATVSFAGAEFTDTKEESIPSTGHTYEYVDNGDSTHTKTCTICDESESEPHTYEDGTCKYCKAEEPEEHSH